MSEPTPRRREFIIPTEERRVRDHLDVIKPLCLPRAHADGTYEEGIRDTLHWVLNGGEPPISTEEPRCRECGCTENDCSYCIKRTGQPCTWVEEDLCSACASEQTS